jgi:hypothetical protein
MDEVGVRMWVRVRDARGKQRVLVESNIPAISVLGGTLIAASCSRFHGSGPVMTTMHSLNGSPTSAPLASADCSGSDIAEFPELKPISTHVYFLFIHMQ